MKMHGMTDNEMKMFKSIKEAERRMTTPGDVKAVQGMCAEWVRSAPTEMSKTRRRNMIRAVKFAHTA
jgi:hypothetical protein